MKHLPLSLLCLFASVCSVRANGLLIDNVSATTSSITFQIAWDNSWNIENLSRDAVWVFIKYQDCQSSNKAWDHLNLSITGGDHSATGSLLQVNAVSDGKGVFIRRSAFGGGNNPLTQVTLRFANPFSSISDINFDVVGIEMVYVAEGSFYASDGASANRFGNNGGGSIREITSEDVIPANGLSTTTSTSSSNNHLRHPAIIEEFPKGYSGFYCMKYEITQSQYVHFLNSLPASLQAIRTHAVPTSAPNTQAMTTQVPPRRNGIKIITPAGGDPMAPAVYGIDLNNNTVYNEADDGLYIAANYLNWGDLLAFLDWAALRPMTELEYEKASRGPASAGQPIAGEFAWGSTVWRQARAYTGTSTAVMSNAGMDNEISTNPGEGLSAQNGTTSSNNDNTSYNMTAGNNNNGPLRVGFAAGNGTSRGQAGSTYYGIMEMSGNVREQCIAIGSISIGAALFTGELGDGTLDINGDADQTGWGLANEAKWSVLRGGCWSSLATSEGRTSDRTSIGNTGGATRSSSNGGRGVRQY